MSLSATGPTPKHAKPDDWGPLPRVDLRHLLKMTDDTGVFQHAVYDVPDLHHGYCIDDNARALIAAVHQAQLFDSDEPALPLKRYLAFLAYAFNRGTGRFRNFMGYDRRWLEDVGSPDSQGRTIWALGTTASATSDDDTRDLAIDLIDLALPGVEKLWDLRSLAFTVIGLEELLKAAPRHRRALSLRDKHAQSLMDAFERHSGDNWPWCEDKVIYDNAKLCHALLVSGRSMQRDDMIEQGLESLRWLLDVQTAEGGHLSIIGNQGWLPRGGEKAPYDQQPLEAHALVHGCLTAAKVSQDPAWAGHAWRCFQWFTGRNDLGVSLYAPKTGGCRDGLHPEGVNRNQGAESSLAYLLSVLELHRYRATTP